VFCGCSKTLLGKKFSERRFNSIWRPSEHNISSFTQSDLSFQSINSEHNGVSSQHLVDAFFSVIRDKGFTAFDFDVAFRSWELQAGYPVIYVNVTESRQFLITQERFLTQKQTQEPSNFYIPLNFATESNPDFDDTKITNYFVNDQPNWKINFPAEFDASQWFVFNKQQLGYYRVNYDFANWHALILVLNSDDYDKIHVLNRVQLIDDAINLAAGGYLDYNTVFGILTYLERETEYTPWYAADRLFSQLYTTFGPKNVDLNVSFTRGLKVYIILIMIFTGFPLQAHRQVLRGI
jgi:aminopeptidase N